LVLVDMGLESYDPLRFCSAVRAFDGTRLAPVLAIASANETRHVLRALDLGVSDYILSPIDNQELAARVRTQLRRMRYIKYLRESFDQTFEMAILDQLTGLYNRRFLASQGVRLIEEAQGKDIPMACLMVDIDHFKKVNDTLGHDAGDEVLKEVAGRLTTSVRGSDLACRTGGEEFAVLMPRTPPESAQEIADRILHSVAGEPVRLDGGTSLDVTVSIGCSMLTNADTLASVLKRADQALYKSKENGRNQVTNAAA
ncbi:MAG: diguanylate cyclase, partial [Pseudomonadota bacterium]